VTAPSPAATLVDAGARPALAGEMDALVAENLPPFMMWASPGNWRWHRIYERYPDYQMAALDGDGALLGAVHAVPVAWRGAGDPLPGGYDDVLVQAADGDAPPAGGALCLLSISVRPTARGTGLPAVLLAEMRGRAAARGHAAVIAPLRPTGKAAHPRVPMAVYVAWTDARGEPADPWLRTHVRLGARVLGIAERSLVISQPRARWEAVAGRPLPPGLHDVPGALAPVEVDARGIGCYAEPNVWVCHPVPPGPPAP
jgi:GNAT superfamily N-acetyltransferase